VRRLAVVAVLALLATPAIAADRTTPLPAGESAPEIRLADQHGKSFVLADVLKSRDFVVVAFYPRAFTSG